MNPLLLAILRMLMQQQGGKARPGPQTRRPGAGARAGGGNPMDPSSGSRYSPQGFQALQWLAKNYWDPGRIGESDTPGAGKGYGFGGFTRGTSSDPYRNRAVGDVRAMRGGLPNFRESPWESLSRNVGGVDRNSLDAWLSDIYRREGRTDLPDSKGRDPIFGEGPRFGAGAGDVWRDFFSRGSSLESMDRALRGEGLGGGGSNAGWQWLV